MDLPIVLIKMLKGKILAAKGQIRTGFLVKRVVVKVRVIKSGVLVILRR